MICSSVYLLFFMSVILHGLTDFSTFRWYGWVGAGHKVDAAMQTSRIPVEQLSAVTKAIVEFNSSCPDEQMILLNELNQLSDSEREKIASLERLILDRLSDLLIKVDSKGKITPLNKRIYTMMFLGIVNYTFAWYNPNGRVGPAEFADLADDIFLNGLLSPQVTTRSASA